MNCLRFSALLSFVLLVSALVVGCGPVASTGTTGSGQAAPAVTARVRYLVPTVT